MPCTQHGTGSHALDFPTQLSSAPTRSKRTGEPGTQFELQECPINAEIWLPRLHNAGTGHSAVGQEENLRLRPEIREGEENGFLMMLEDRSA